MLKKIVQIVLIFPIIFLNLGFNMHVKATSDFDIHTDYIIRYNELSEFVNVKESVKFSVNNKDYYLRSGATHSFYIPKISSSKDSDIRGIRVLNSSDIEMDYRKTESNEGIEVIVVIPTKITSYEPYVLTLEYSTSDFLNRSGNIANLYIPGLPTNTKLSTRASNGLTTTKSYNTKVLTSKGAPLPSFIQPNSIERKEGDRDMEYIIPTEGRIGKTSWIQFGNTQYYKFKLVQEALKNDNITPKEISNIAPMLSTNIYKVAIPREYDETNQKILIQSFNPQPKRIERDSEGNLIATFEVPANNNTEIVIEGLISMSKPDITKSSNFKDIPLSQYFERIKDGNELTGYTTPGKYWESTDPVVSKIAQDILSRSNTISQLVKNNYEYIVNEFDYSYEKLEQGNIRLGAKAALTGSPAICMEYSDALTALFRAQGIPARIAIGYGNDPNNRENKIENDKLVQQKIGHQWTQVWIPDYGWLSVDPTWGESNRTYIGSDLDHILWYSNGTTNQDITDVIFYSAQISNLGEYKVYIQALDQKQYNEEKENSQTIDEFVISQKGNPPIDFYLKTSLAGKVLVFLIPIVVALIVGSLITSTIYFVKGRVKKKP